MLRVLEFVAIAALTGVASTGSAQIAKESRPTPQLVEMQAGSSVNDIIDRVIAREHEEMKIINSYRPIVETYVQVYNRKRDTTTFLTRDHYYLGQAELSDKKQFGYRSMLTKKDQYPQTGLVHEEFNPLGFVQMAYVDQAGFDKRHYAFQYVGREFLGDVRCVVFDLQPLSNAGPGRFYGRIWAEDKNDTIVRFNGVYLPVKHKGHYNSHFDSWRLNVNPDIWVPAYVFTEETDLQTRQLQIKYINDLDQLRFKAQTRFWGYDLKEPSHEQEFSDLVVEAPSRGTERTVSLEERDQSPLQSQRVWQEQAENNVLAALQKTGLLASAGEVDKALGTVVNNLEVTNNLSLDPPVRCRVLMTSTFDLFAVGHVIVISRGLLDVLPDEAALAAMLAQELGEIIVSKARPDRYAFYDIVQLQSLYALRNFSFKLNDRDLAASNQKALALLRNSPYKDNLGTAGLFLKQLQENSRVLHFLVAPHLGNRVYVASELTSPAPSLQRDNLNQVAALPLGARIKVNPWTDELELMKARPTPPLSATEKMPLELTPFMPYLTRYSKLSGDSAKVSLDRSDSASSRAPNK